GAALATFYTTFACNEGFPYDPSCGSYRGGDVWFRVTVPASGSIRLIASQGLTASRRINRMGFTMYTAAGSCSDYDQFSEIACVSTTLTSTSETTLSTVGCLVPGSTVYIRAFPTNESQSTSGSSRYGAFRLRVTNPAGTPGTIANNIPCTATPLGFGSCPTYVSGLATFNDNTACTAPGVPAPGCGTFSSTTSRDVWYRFVAPASGTVGIHVNGNTSSIPVFDAAAALYTAASGDCNGPLTLVDCDDDHGPGLGAYIIRTDLVPGDTYYIRVWGEGTSGSQTGIFYICLTEPVPAAGNCFYLLRMSYDGTGGSQTMRVAIGADTTDYTTTMGEPNEYVLVEVPSGLTVTFIYYNTGLTGGIWFTYDGAQLGQIPTWIYRGGGAVAGPSPGPAYSYTVNSCAPFAAAREDCLGSRTICGPTAVVDTTFLDYDSGYRGYITDLTVENRGCLQNENRAGRWFIFRAQADGEVSFALQGLLSPTEDIDFAVWDAGAQPVGLLPNVTPSICSPNAPPVRCSSARVAARTGLLPYLPNRTSEGTGGFGWLSPLPVLQDHVYLLYVVNMDIPITAPPYPPIIRRQNYRRFSLQWTSLLNSSGAPDNTILDCTPLILPVELLAFDAWRQEQDAQLSWSTATERNSDHFVVERSTDGSVFKSIGVVPAAGNSAVRRDYDFTDDAPFLGTNYYRLKMVDQDHGMEYSDVRVVIFAASDRLVAFPDPAADEINLTYGGSGSTIVHVSIIDAMGRQVLERSWRDADGAGRVTLNISALARGSYIIRSTDGRGEVMAVRFIKG
ncbi:MAG: T9SS type A sorting domain-containing protein, partial [Flavobacteriales bacterium]